MFDNAGRIPDGHAVRGDIARYYRACADDHVVADGDPRQDCDAAADPHIIADGHRERPLIPRVALLGVERMTGRVDADVRPDESVVTEGYVRFIENREIEICEEILADENVAP